MHLHRQASYQLVSAAAHLHSLWGCQVNWLTHYNPLPILRSQSSSAREKVASDRWLHLHIHNLHASNIGMTTLVQTHLLRGGRIPDSFRAPLSWSHTVQHGAGRFCWALLLSGITGALSSDELLSVELLSASEQLAISASADRVLMSEAMLSRSNFRYTNCALSSKSLSSSDDGFNPTTGSRSSVSLTYTILSLFVHLLCRVLTHTTSPILYFPCALQETIAMSMPRSHKW